ncbi:MAG: lipid A biosynthesis protein [Coxiella sp. RIFCSPHIGHO2_12_FULL_42_15]|nr:MAG: lipid A biosynthesis protein [Coxiella sp. RIFCSPHIGHO2_12_FULL_42_15]
MFKAYSNLNLVWLMVGFSGQLLFSARFLVQWLVSEYRRKSVIPDVFWYFSLGGGIVLLTYAIYKQDPVFILGQGMGLIVYLRNIYFIRKAKSEIAGDSR